jgi:catechol 2,3-dioxygenase-like lactoylglutathione lyase family enzyme
MQLNLLGLRTVIYPTRDLQESRDWWAKSLGRAPYFDEEFYVGFNVGGYELGLLPDGNLVDGAQVYWGVEDVASSIEFAVAQGASILGAATDVGDGIVTATVRLPDGSVVGFIYNPHFLLN